MEENREVINNNFGTLYIDNYYPFYKDVEIIFKSPKYVPVYYMYINKEEAIKIIDHLKSVFEII